LERVRARFPPRRISLPCGAPCEVAEPEEFVERMKGLAATSLRSFKEVP
jgi:hypothetical protein